MTIALPAQPWLLMFALHFLVSARVTTHTTLTSPVRAAMQSATGVQYERLVKSSHVARNGSPRKVGSAMYEEDRASGRPAKLSKCLLHAQLCAQIAHRLSRPRLPNTWIVDSGPSRTLVEITANDLCGLRGHCLMPAPLALHNLLLDFFAASVASWPRPTARCLWC